MGRTTSDYVSADEGDVQARKRLAAKGVKRSYTDTEAVNKAILGAVAMTAGGPEAALGKIGARALSKVAARRAASAAGEMKNVTPRAPMALPKGTKTAAEVGKSKRAAAKAKLTKASTGSLGKGATKDKPMLRAPDPKTYAMSPKERVALKNGAQARVMRNPFEEIERTRRMPTLTKYAKKTLAKKKKVA